MSTLAGLGFRSFCVLPHSQVPFPEKGKRVYRSSLILKDLAGNKCQLWAIFFFFFFFSLNLSHLKRTLSFPSPSQADAKNHWVMQEYFLMLRDRTAGRERPRSIPTDTQLSCHFKQAPYLRASVSLLTQSLSSYLAVEDFINVAGLDCSCSPHSS